MHNPDDYRHLKKRVIIYMKKKGVDSEIISEYSVLVGVPLTVVYTFISEEFPEHKEFCDEKIKSFKKFYGY